MIWKKIEICAFSLLECDLDSIYSYTAIGWSKYTSSLGFLLKLADLRSIAAPRWTQRIEGFKPQAHLLRGINKNLTTEAMKFSYKNQCLEILGKLSI